MLVVSEPKAIVAVIIGKIVDSLPMLLVLEPLTLVFLTVVEGIHTKALTQAFFVFSFVDIAVFIRGTPLTVGLTRL